MGTSLNSNLETLFSKMENFISTKTVIGEPVTVGDVIIVPLVDVTFGVGAGASLTPEKEKDNISAEAGGGGLGASIKPSAVLVVINGTAQLVNVKNQDSLNKLIDMVPSLVTKLNLGSFFAKKQDVPEDNGNSSID